eukprot:434200_1
MALPLFLISTLFITNAQDLSVYHQLTYPEELAIDTCEMVYDTRNLANLGPHGSATCVSPMPCACTGPVFNPLLLEETTTDSGFNLTDHSSLDLIINLGQTYLFDIIKFTWLYKNSPINQATSYVSLFDAGLNDWVPHGYEYRPVDGSGSAVKVNATVSDKVVTHLRFHLEWDFDSPTGIVQPSGVVLYGETQTQFPTAEPSRSPSTLPTTSPTTDPTTDPSAQPTQNPSTTPTSASQSPTKSPSDLPTSASQAPTKSPTNPRSGLVSVLLDDVSVQCCNGSSQQQLSVPDDTITDITYYPCCYPSDDGYFTADMLPNADYIYTYSCPSAGSSISFAQLPVTVVYATGYDPNIGTACGTHQFLSDNSFLSQFNIVSLPIELHGGSYNASEWNIPSCLCSMEH